MNSHSVTNATLKEAAARGDLEVLKRQFDVLVDDESITFSELIRLRNDYVDGTNPVTAAVLNGHFSVANWLIEKEGCLEFISSISHQGFYPGILRSNMISLPVAYLLSIKQPEGQQNFCKYLSNYSLYNIKEEAFSYCIVNKYYEQALFLLEQGTTFICKKDKELNVGIAENVFSFLKYFNEKHPKQFYEYFDNEEHITDLLALVINYSSTDLHKLWKYLATKTKIPLVFASIAYANFFHTAQLKIVDDEEHKDKYLYCLAYFYTFDQAPRPKIQNFCQLSDRIDDSYHFAVKLDLYINEILQREVLERRQKLKNLSEKFEKLFPVLAAMSQIDFPTRMKCWLIASTVLDIHEILSIKDKGDLLKPFLSASNNSVCHNALLNGTLLFQLKSKLAQNPEFRAIIAQNITNRLY